MKNYVSPSVEVILFEDNILAANTSEVCNCSAVQYENNTSLIEGCEATTYGYIEIGNHY